MKSQIRLFFLGDIVGPLGRKAVKKYLAFHKEKDGIDFVIANGENTTHGHGLSYDHYLELVNDGIDVLTSGNHFFGASDALRKADSMPNALRPYNFDPSVPGKGSALFTTKDGFPIRVTNLIGRVFLNGAQSNPFYALDEILRMDEGKRIIHFVDFHAEATAEKRCLAEYGDGRITALIGTHTHVQTNDPHLLNKGTFFLSDAGMNGAYDSSLGDDVTGAMMRTMTGIPQKYDVPRAGKMLVNGVLLDISTDTCQVVSYHLINETLEDD